MTNHRRQLTTDLNTHLTKISIPYQCRKSLLSHGIWNSLLNMIEIIHQNRSATKCFLSMGIMKNSKLYLYPEEAIFLMQSSLLQVFMENFNQKQNIPISLDEAYSMWFTQSLLTLKDLHVYQYLTRIGFILIRHQSQAIMMNTKEDLLKTTQSSKRKRDEYENEAIEIPEEEFQDDSYICPVNRKLRGNHHLKKYPFFIPVL
jgi:homoserine trans-succinylase